MVFEKKINNRAGKLRESPAFKRTGRPGRRCLVGGRGPSEKKEEILIARKSMLRHFAGIEKKEKEMIMLL